MTIGTSDGQYFDDEFDYHHSKIFPEQSEPKGEGKAFFVRHGDTDLNNEDIIHGWVDTPLNDEGIDDAHKAAESLKDKDITRIVSSDLPRAVQTANILSQKLKVPVTFDSNLRTWDSGDFDGTKDHEELKKYTEDGKANKAPAGSSESFNEFKDRSLSTISGYIKNGEDENTVLVTHSKPIRVFDAWEHGGYADDIHQKTYDKEECVKPGGHQEISMPAHVSYKSRFEQPRDTFDQRFEGEPGTLPTTFPGEIFQPVEYNTLKDEIVRPKWPGERDIQPIETDADKFNSTLYQPVADLKQQQPLETGGGAPTNTVIKGPGVPEVRDPYGGPGRGGGRKIPDETWDKVRDMSSQGKSTAEISDETGIPRGTLLRGMWERQFSSTATKPSPWTDNPDALEKLKDLRSKGMSLGDIANEMGTSRDVIAGKLRRESMKGNSNRSDFWTKNDGENEQKLRDMLNSGKSQYQIADEMGVDRATLQGKMSRLGLTGSKPDTKELDARDTKLLDMANKGNTIVQIAREMGMTPGKVSGRLFRLRNRQVNEPEQQLSGWTDEDGVRVRTKTAQ